MTFGPLYISSNSSSPPPQPDQKSERAGYEVEQRGLSHLHDIDCRVCHHQAHPVSHTGVLPIARTSPSILACCLVVAATSVVLPNEGLTPVVPNGEAKEEAGKHDIAESEEAAPTLIVCNFRDREKHGQGIRHPAALRVWVLLAGHRIFCRSLTPCCHGDHHRLAKDQGAKEYEKYVVEEGGNEQEGGHPDARQPDDTQEEDAHAHTENVLEHPVDSVVRGVLLETIGVPEESEEVAGEGAGYVDVTAGSDAEGQREEGETSQTSCSRQVCNLCEERVQHDLTWAPPEPRAYMKVTNEYRL
eukprot:CAMPEP_0118652014 /NCGR_PEP_ID=MMETSP0785-20121206/11090_1 /TAXON_ID=91992 /ORGANISM="Bolidomonas pacifica, Strain CCMP 1866" /LENGTH=300 /DNA_ID=CAMNT_0006544499 /DNA_START=94 /DNA_END=999 /DNA_ORIENTATION=+